MKLLGCVSYRLQAGERPNCVGEFSAHTSDSAVCKTGCKQPVTSIHAVARARLSAKFQKKVNCAPDVGFQIFKELPVLFQFTLTNQSEHGDGCIFPVFAATTGHNLP